jgi:hypothetical protein
MDMELSASCKKSIPILKQKVLRLTEDINNEKV